MNTRGKDAEVEAPKSNGGKFRFQPRPWRFRVKPGEIATIIFLTNYDDSLVLNEHRFDILGPGQPIYGNALTCAAMVGEKCPLCQVKKKYDLGFMQSMRYFSIIDTRPFKPKNGPEKKYQKLVLAQPLAMETQFARMAGRCAKKRKTEGDLRGAKFEVLRADEKRSCAIGTSYDFMGFQKLAGSSIYASDDVIPFTDEEFAVNMEMLEDAASVLTERNHDIDDDEEDAEDVPY